MSYSRISLWVLQTATEWAASTQVLRTNEAGLESDTGKAKQGNGLDVFSALSYLPGFGAGGGSMVYPGVGIPLSTGAAWGTSIINNSANWNTAFGWGNHAGLYLGATALAGGELSGNYPNPSLSNAAVIAKTLTGLSYIAGTLAATDSIIDAFIKLAATSNRNSGDLAQIMFTYDHSLMNSGSNAFLSEDYNNTNGASNIININQVSTGVYNIDFNNPIVPTLVTILILGFKHYDAGSIYDYQWSKVNDYQIELRTYKSGGASDYDWTLTGGTSQSISVTFPGFVIP